MRILWIENISKGGLFVATSDPPPLRSRVDVHIDAPAGRVTLSAEVVHILDASAAQALGMEPGVGLQFLGLDDKMTKVIERYVEGIAERMQRETQDLEVQTTVSVREVMEHAHQLLQRTDLYEALNISPKAPGEEIGQRIRELEELFSNPPKEANPAQLLRIASTKKMLDRVSRVLLVPGRRLEHDLRASHLRIEDLLARPGDEVRKMRDAWKVSFPDRLEQAKERASTATEYLERGDLDAAIRTAQEAIRLDPLNRDLRSALREWQKLKDKPKPE